MRHVDQFYCIKVRGAYYFRDAATKKDAYGPFEMAQLFHDRRQAVHVCNKYDLDRSNILPVRVTRELI